jgi:hypothetical protein
MTDSGSAFIVDMLGSGVLKPETEREFLEWCIVNTVRPAFAHALSTHDLSAEGRLMMSADTAEKVAALSRRISEGAKQTMFRQLALWIEGAVHYENARTAWNNAREAAVWSLIYSQRGRDVARQAEQYQQFDKQIRQTHSSRLREIMGKA